MKSEDIKKAVREGYAKVAKKESSCCAPVESCCDPSTSEAISKEIGYNEVDVNSVPEGANLGLGCGNPIALASLKEGETVLDLGAGAGFDCFLASQRVGKTGKVIGVDMTPEMVDKARENARKDDYGNVEFRLGEIESLPVADNSVDVVISNCVINLSPEKERVFREAYRVLKPGGRLMVSDIVLERRLPESILNSIEAYIGCLSGAIRKEDYLVTIERAGFQDVKVEGETVFPIDFIERDPTMQAVFDKVRLPREEIEGLARSVISLSVSAERKRPIREPSRPS